MISMEVKYKFLYYSLSLVLSIIILQILVYTEFDLFLNFSSLPTFPSFFNYMQSQLLEVSLLYDIFYSIKRVVSGFILASAVSIPLAYLIARNKYFNFVFYPLLEIMRPIPNVAWVPLSIILLKTIDGSVIFITFISAFFPIFINSLQGFSNIPLNYIKTHKVMRVPKIYVVFQVYLPSALPNIKTGLILGISGSWLGLIVAEMISGSSGIGYYTWKNYTLLDINGVLLGMILIGILGSLSTLLINALFQKVKWL